MIDLHELLAVSYLAPNWFAYYEAVTASLARRFNVNIRLVQEHTDPLEDPFLLADKLDLAFICGLSFFRHHQLAPDHLQVLAAPVMQSSRYQNQPVYFSDVIVNADSPTTHFADLYGQFFCYNDRGSHSGFYAVHRYLQMYGYGPEFITHAVPTGSHQASLRWVAEGHADWAAIDSTVLKQEQQNHPVLSQKIRIVTAIGPAPMPPVVAASHLGTKLLSQFQGALLDPDTQLQTVMQQYGVNRYASVDWMHYQTYFHPLLPLPW